MTADVNCRFCEGTGMAHYGPCDSCYADSRRLASPPADQPADHIGEGKTFEQIKALIEADEAGRLSVCDLRTLLSLIARQQETIRADGGAIAYAVERFGMWTAQTANMEAALDGLRARLSARQPKEPK